MLRELELTDFESHDSTKLTFVNGLNVIHGLSHVGKSAVLRALSLPAYGEWAGGDDKKQGKHGPVRAGAKLAVVRLASHRGEVTVRRGPGVNEWCVSPTEGEPLNFKSPGTGAVPEAVDVLGLRCLRVAGLEVRINWADQRDKHFLLDEVEGQAASPSLAAAIVDEVAGLNGCEDLVRALASEKTSLETQVKKHEGTLVDVETQLYGPPYINVDKRAELLTNVQGIVDQLKHLSAEARWCDDSIMKRNGLVTNVTELSDRVTRRAQAETPLVESLTRLGELVTALRDAQELHRQRVKLLSKLQVLDTSPPTPCDVDVSAMKAEVDNLRTTAEWATRRSVLVQKVNTLEAKRPPDVRVDVVALTALNDTCQVLDTADKLLTERARLSGRVTTLGKRHDMARTLHDEETTRLRELVQTTSVCPLTQRPFHASCVEALSDVT